MASKKPVAKKAAPVKSYSPPAPAKKAAPAAAPPVKKPAASGTVPKSLHVVPHQGESVIPKPARKTAATGRKQHVRMTPAERGPLVLAAALKVAGGKGGIEGLTRATIAKAANVTDGLVNRYLGNRADMEKAVALAAVESKVVKVVAEGITRGLLTQSDMPRNLWREARALYAK